MNTQFIQKLNNLISDFVWKLCVRESVCVLHSNDLNLKLIDLISYRFRQRRQGGRGKIFA